MVCLEFDLREHGLQADSNLSEKDAAFNRNFRKINQEFIEKTFQFKINGNCHGQKIFGNGT
jgi:hypothetical protein